MTDAIAKIGSFDLDMVITDLYFGISGSSSADLLHHFEKQHPRVEKVVLTSLPLPALDDPNGIELPTCVNYLVKSEFGSHSDLI